MGKFIDLTGREFGRLKVLSRTENSKSKGTRWLCRCECGEERVIFASNLMRGTSLSCGCLSAETTSKRLTKDLTGKKFGKLTVKERSGSNDDGAVWLCFCECGGKKSVASKRLVIGHTTSCGCRMSERRKTHGMSGTRLYKIWAGMRSRCLNQRTNLYRYYGGRGITVCHEWGKFEVFAEWAVSSGYNETLTLDREKNNIEYSPDNCRWVTMLEQARNTRNLKPFYATSPIGRRYRADCQTKFAEEHDLNSNSLHLSLKLNRPLYGWVFEYV